MGGWAGIAVDQSNGKVRLRCSAVHIHHHYLQVARHRRCNAALPMHSPSILPHKLSRSHHGTQIYVSGQSSAPSGQPSKSVTWVR